MTVHQDAREILGAQNRSPKMPSRRPCARRCGRPVASFRWKQRRIRLPRCRECTLVATTQAYEKIWRAGEWYMPMTEREERMRAGIDWLWKAMNSGRATGDPPLRLSRAAPTPEQARQFNRAENRRNR